MGTREAIIDLIDESYNSGEIDNVDLREINLFVISCARDVRRRQGAKVASKLRGGMKVQIRRDSGLRPSALLGVEATVVRVNKTTATIKLGDVPFGRAGRFHSGDDIRCPLTALEIV